MGWGLIDHVCQHCAGRIISRTTDEGELQHRCTNCGAEVMGEHTELCWCGASVQKYGLVFECFVNPKKSISMPQEVLIRERARVPQSLAVKVIRYAGSGEDWP